MLIYNTVFWNNIQGDVSHLMGCYVTFENIPESEWMALINQGFSPAINIYWGIMRGNLDCKNTEGYPLYKFGIAPYVF